MTRGAFERAAAAVAAVALLVSACGGASTRQNVARRPRFSFLDTTDRAFFFRHGIEVLDLANGLRVALRPDARTNLVGVDVRYQVGNVEDPAGRRGLAHLVEHLAFEVRVAPDQPTIAAELAELALGHNAYTSDDETHYTAIAFADRLDALLAIEARRMTITCDQLSEELFVRERDVVLAELTERATPYTRLRDEIAAAVWGPAHPYGRARAPQVAAATRQDACDFLAAHYTPDRAILVVTGSFDVAATRAAITERFGAIAGAAAGARVEVAPPALTGTHSVHRAPVDEATAIVVFHAPRWGGEDRAIHDLVALMLRRELARIERGTDWITDVTVGDLGGWQARALAVAVSVDDPVRLDAAVQQVFRAAREVPGTTEAMLRAMRGHLRTEYLGSYDDVARSATWIADFLQYTSHGRFFLQDLDALEQVTGGQIRVHAARHLKPEHTHVALVYASGDATVTRASVERPARVYDLEPWRAPVDPAEAARTLAAEVPRARGEVIEYHLDNGLRVLLAPDPASVMVDARLVFPVGSAADPPDRAGLAELAGELLDHDYAQDYSREERRVLEWVLGHGTQRHVTVDERTTVIATRGIATYFDWHLWRLFWLVDAGVYHEEALATVRARARSAEDDDADGPQRKRDDALRTRLFGAGHPYATAADDTYLRVADRAELAEFRARHYRARGATLIVAGRFSVPVVRRAIADLFGAWSGAAPPTAADVPPIRPADGPSYVGVVDPDAAQLEVSIAFAASSDTVRDAAARRVLDEMLDDRARRIRESLGATYGVAVGYEDGAGGGILHLTGSVDADRAADAVVRLLDEVRALRRDATSFPEDFVRARRRALAQVLADAAGASVRAGELQRVAVRGLATSHADALADEVAATTLADVAALARTDLAARRMVVVVSGPRAELDRVFAEAKLEAEIVE